MILFEQTGNLKDMMLNILRSLRHGPLKFFSPVWVLLGSFYRFSTRSLRLAASHFIGGYGPFLLDGRFAFSDFNNWGHGHNNGFVECVEACRDCKTVLDIGAHIGLFSLPISEVIAEGGAVHAFEPAQANISYLHRHVELNKLEHKIKVHQSLVGDVVHNAVAFYELAESTGMNTTVTDVVDENYDIKFRPQTTIDVFCSRFELVPEVIKIDVEGAEIAVLKGGQKVIDKFKPKIFLSVHPRQIKSNGQSIEELISVIEMLQYSIKNVDGSEVSEFKLEEYLLAPRETC